MTIRPRGNAYQVDVKVSPKENPTGEVVRIRTTSKDETTARRLEAEIRAAVMKHGHWSPEAGSAPSKMQGTLSAALDEAWSYPTGRLRGWKYQKAGKTQYTRAESCIKILGPDRHCATVTTADFERLTKFFEKEGNSSDTINYKIQALRRVLWHAQRKGWITHRPLWDRPAPGAPRDFIYDPDLEAKVIAFFRETVRRPLFADLFILGIETGMRLGELLKSWAGDWQLNAGIVVVRAVNAKSGSARAITLTERAKETIKPYIDRSSGDRDQLFKISANSITYNMKQCRVHLGYEDTGAFCFHATRHTRATRLARQTRDPFLVMSQLGHGDIETSMRYIKLASIDLTTGGGNLNWDTSGVCAPVTQA